jgi:uncharacterized protein YgfB (UPF0149 family)
LKGILKTFMDHLPEYSDIISFLEKADGDVSPAEAQGIACGLLAVNLGSDQAQWLDEILPGDRDRLNVLLQEAEAGLAQIFIGVMSQLSDSNLQFELLLPDDEASLENRFEAVQSWSRGLLYGLSIAGLNQYERLPEDSREFLQDVVQISTPASFDFDEDDESEDAYTEIVEYLRVGTLLLAEEVQPTKQESVAIH